MYYIDTNILIYLFCKNVKFYKFSKEIFERIVTEKQFFLHEIILTEFFSIITNPKKIKDPFTEEEAYQLIKYLIMLAEDIHFINEEILDEALKDLQKYKISKYKIYDHLIAYSIKYFKLKGIVTANYKDFNKYDFIEEIIAPKLTNKEDTKISIFIPYGKQYIDSEDIQSVIEILNSDFLTQGPKVKEFEEKLAQYCGAKYAVAFNSGTSALHGAYFASGLADGDEFITSPITFAATSNAGLFLEAKPVFVDIESDTGNIDVNKIERTITDKTKLIVPIHYAGHSCNMEEINKIANKYNLKIVEDACPALGGLYKDSKIGSCKYSDMTVFSFHPVKHITTGEGGAVLTNDKELYEKLLMFRSHGITKEKEKLINTHEGNWYYEIHYLGYNYRITDIQCALGLSQLKKLDNFIKRRREIVNIYNEAFKDNPFFDLPVEKDYALHAYHLYPIRLKDQYKDEKKEVFKKLKENGVGVQVHYIPVYWHPYYKGLGYKKGLCAVAEDFYQKEISLPLYPAQCLRKDVRKRAEELVKLKFGIADAAHVAFAEKAGAEFVSCDRKLINKCRRYKIKV